MKQKKRKKAATARSHTRFPAVYTKPEDELARKVAEKHWAATLRVDAHRAFGLITRTLFQQEAKRIIAETGCASYEEYLARP